MRGAEAEITAAKLVKGIIPARAGSRRGSEACALCGRDHPRACGEQEVLETDEPMREGSSPRVRGAVTHLAVPQVAMRIIPARAGSSISAAPCHLEARDHPRACGEQLAKMCGTSPVTGSSPRVRGAVWAVRGGRAYFRIIPARAGSSLHHAGRRESMWDHPRACGEQSSSTVLMMNLMGSSPRVRGAARDGLLPVG